MFNNAFNSKKVGIGYLVLSTFGGFLGFSFSSLLRVELSCPFLVTEEKFYYFCLTSHGVIMVFYFLTILSSTFSNYLFPDLCFFSDFNFTKLSLISISSVLLSIWFMILSGIITEGPICGWTFYVPLSISLGLTLDLIVVGVYIFSFYSISNSTNIITTSFLFRTSINEFLLLPVFVWSYILTSLLFIFSIPALACSLGMSIMDRNQLSYFFDFEFGGDVILYQTLFWLWGHAEVYALILPVFGVVTMVLQFLCGGWTYNKIGVSCSMASISILSLFVWGHHMVLGGFSFEVKNYFMIGTIIIGIPTGIKLFSWILGVYFSSRTFSIPLGFIISFLLSFSLGGITGVFLSGTIMDTIFHDGYFVVGHFHFQLALASIFGFLSGIFFFYRSLLNIGKNFWYLGLMFYSMFSIMSFQIFSPMNVVGVLGIPRRVLVYSFEYFFLFYLSSIGFIGVWFCLLIFVFYIMSMLVIFSND